ncbi:hypothetical protein FPZ12_025590 [Amycolatopsis acidicola]|uniref:Uncharacterized protein n=1 Tax=Amycolatopsis acidicola TaxID=2596893 RepID=A0A5N0UZA9_9PSEU|nr:hypothetical protein [Amycolatopsis acidicola]KAA9157164.1 hypothetical protein FPZ12_025590 [Amycolatopsis acidicola]
MVTELGDLVGKRLLFSVRYVADDGSPLRELEECGVVTAVDDSVVTIALPRHDEPFTLPAEPDAYDHARPGEYRLRTTGEVVVDPDFTSVWTVRAPAPEAPAEEGAAAPEA